MTQASITRAGPERLDDLEPLWHSLHAHHAALPGELAPIRAVEDSWRLRRDQYRRWLAGGSTVLLVADDGERAVGYLMLGVGGAWPTWDIGDRVAEVETLAVLPDARGRGIGEALMSEARAAARQFGAESLVVGLAHTNDGARRFYERVGFRPFYLQMLASTS